MVSIRITICLFAALLGCYGLPLSQNEMETDEFFPDYQLGVRYDEYPLIVPKKRTALLMNRLMVALKEAIQDEQRNDLKGLDNFDKSIPRSSKNFPEDVRTMDLERRGRGNLQQKGRNYWRCYFNAVTCF